MSAAPYISVALLAFLGGVLAQQQLADYRLKSSPCDLKAWNVDRQVYTTVRQDPMDCVELGEMQEYSGVWITEFEGSAFVQGQKEWIDRDKQPVALGNRTWLDSRLIRGNVYDLAKSKPTLARTQQYYVTIRGRESKRPGNYGHAGGSDRLIIAYFVDSAVELFPPGHE